MRRDTIINWHHGHEGIKPAIDAGIRIKDPHELADVSAGWSYVTFFPLGTTPDQVLFDLSKLESTVEQLGYFLPDEVVAEHNKIVVTAMSVVQSAAHQLYGLLRLIEEFGKRYSSPEKHPRLGYYGKVGGIYLRPEKGRVLVLYAQDDESLLEIEAALQELILEFRVPGVEFEIRLGNGLSDLPRLLKGYGEPEYRQSGVHHFKITDPTRFETLVQQARVDYANYLFDKPHEIK
ncbi:MAG: hypothetical protein ABIK09_16370 [Pseudomonadota bacterium]